MNSENNNLFTWIHIKIVKCVNMVDIYDCKLEQHKAQSVISTGVSPARSASADFFAQDII